MFTPKPLSYSDELPAFAVLASPAEGYIYCVRKWNKGLSAEPEVVLRVNPDVPRSEERQLPCWRDKWRFPPRSEKEGVADRVALDW